jgi:hypothetical protein
LELSSIEQEMQTLDETHKKTSSDVETTMLSLETTSEQVTKTKTKKKFQTGFVNEEKISE